MSETVAMVRERATIFWRRVLQTDGCWIWQTRERARRASGDYGRFAVTRSAGRPVVMAAHRVSWMLTHGPIPDGMYVCHHCDNPKCVRPDHLFLGTQVDNMRDMREKGRWDGVVGERHYRARVTEDDVRAMRRRFDSGEQIRRIARDFGLSESATSDIVHRRTWRRLTDA